MERVTLKIDGMSCDNCVRHVTNALKAVNGVNVERVTIGEATVSFDPASASDDRITQAIEDEGYSVAGSTR